MDSSFSQANDDKTINVPENNEIKKRKNCECCYCYGPDINRFKSCVCCKPYKKYCCFINFLAYFWLVILYILLILLIYLGLLIDYISGSNITSCCLRINL